MKGRIEDVTASIEEQRLKWVQQGGRWIGFQQWNKRVAVEWEGNRGFGFSFYILDFGFNELLILLLFFKIYMWQVGGIVMWQTSSMRDFKLIMVKIYLILKGLLVKLVSKKHCWLISKIVKRLMDFFDSKLL